MNATHKVTVLTGYLERIKSRTTQVEVASLCNEALQEISTNKDKSRGRKPAKGKYHTHEELIRWALFWYFHTDQNQSQVARTCCTSESTISKIIQKYGPEKQEWL